MDPSYLKDSRRDIELAIMWKDIDDKLQSLKTQIRSDIAKYHDQYLSDIKYCEEMDAKQKEKLEQQKFK